MRRDGFAWWRSRLRHILKYCAVARIDHFRGLSAFWEIPAECDEAFRREECGGGELPLVAEDLGIITDDVRELMARFGLPGMKVLMFAFGGRVAENPYAPHNVAPRSVIYTGTHDNDTAAGWWSGSATAQERENFALYTGREVDAGNAAEIMTRMALSSTAELGVELMGDAPIYVAWDGADVWAARELFDLEPVAARAQRHIRQALSVNYLGNSIAGYRAARVDRRELIFFTLWAFVIFLKFFGLECEVWGRLPRAPLAYALSASLCAAFAAALSLLPRRARFACAIVLDFAFSALAVTDLLHLRFYSDLFTFHNFGLSGQVGDVSDSVFALLSPRDALYFCDIPLFFVYYLLAARLRAAHVFGALSPKRAPRSPFRLGCSWSCFTVTTDACRTRSRRCGTVLPYAATSARWPITRRTRATYCARASGAKS